MDNSKSTKRALALSVLAMVLCVTMFIGTTFAWFTDTASTAVNKIQAGTLDVALEMATSWSSGNETPIDWGTAEGQTLRWIAADGRGEDLILWEPGCTYNLNQFRIVNNGNLALKYKIVISGIDGDAKLNEVIDWSYKLADGTAFSITEEGHLKAGESTGAITISGHMQESAGNEYQGLSIDGIGITVVATQDTVENDSYDNQYDKDAVYPVAPILINSDSKKEVTLDNDGKTTDSDVVIVDETAKSTIPAGTLVYAENGEEPAATNDAGVLKRSIKTTETTADSVTYDISYSYQTYSGEITSVTKFGNVVENIIYISAGLSDVKVTHTHNGVSTPMTMLDAMPETISDNTAYYDSENGKIYVWSSLYSEFKVEYKSDFAAAVNGQGYATLEEAIKAANAGDTVILLKYIRITEGAVIIDKDLSIDLAGYILTIANTNDDGLVVTGGATLNLTNSVAERGKYVFECTSSRADSIYVYNTEEGKTTTLNINNPVTLEINAKTNSAIHAFGEKGNAVVNIKDGTEIKVTGSSQTTAVYIDQNATVNMTGGIFDMNVDFNGYGSWNDVVGVLLAGGNGKHQNMVFNLSGGIFKIGGKNAFAQGIQFGAFNSGTYENCVANITGGEIIIAPTEEGEGYAFTAAYKNRGQFLMSGGSVSGKIDALTTTMSGSNADLTVTGGVFNVDPSPYVDTDNYNVTPSGSSWTVTAK